MFQQTQKTDQSQNEDSAPRPNKTGLTEAELMRGHQISCQVGAPAQMFADKEEKEVQAKVDSGKAIQQKEDELQMKASPVQMKEEEELVQGKAIQKAPEEEEVQMKESSGDNNQGTTSASSTQSTLPRDVNARMEAAFNRKFLDVNIHTNDSKATQMNALAFTQGNNVHFAPGQYNPHTSKGQELIGHEYTHVVQQDSGQVAPTTQAKGMSINDNPALENEADVMGKRAAEGKNVNVNGVSSGVQKKEGEGESERRPRVVRQVLEGHTGGYQHIFDENNNLIIMSPVSGNDSFYKVKPAEDYSELENGSVGTQDIAQVSIDEVVVGLHRYYKDRAKAENQFVKRMYDVDKEAGRKYVNVAAVSLVNKGQNDFMENGGWVLFALMLTPLVIEAIPLIISNTPSIISKIPKQLLIKALKSKAGQHLIDSSGESVIDSLISYAFTGDVDLTSIGMNFIPEKGAPEQVQYLIKGLKVVADAAFDYNVNEGQVKILTKNKSPLKALYDLIFSTLAEITNTSIDAEFGITIYKYILRGVIFTPIKGFNELTKSTVDD